MAEEAIPWANMIIMAAKKAIFENANISATTNLIWLTEEYAIMIFISICRKHSTPTKPPPNRATLWIIDKFWVKYKLNLKRQRPNPANFKSKAASTMDPTTGASTWAFGSHKWMKNIGNLTNMPRIRAQWMPVWIKFVFPKVKKEVMKQELKLLKKIIITSNKGSEQIIVYRAMAIIAWRRSGW